ncbi:MAG TPA: hypothetical protein PL182_07280 [Pseudobdellovibrionaceae bacterium]|nr:hypothetical protein [Pseudobdellovibrionaceae bacterium]
MQQGGADAGGGNLLNGRPLESYLFDASGSEEMKQALKLLTPFEGGHESIRRILDFVVHKKSWFLVPVNLPRLSKEEIGIPFSAEQGALQDFEEVWIDQEFFRRMSFEDRVRLLVHEIFMGLKIFTFESYHRQCRVTEPFMTDCLTLATDKNRKEMILTQADYNAVRRAVNTVWRHSHQLLKSPTLEQIAPLSDEIFGGGEFDSYFVKPSLQGLATKAFSEKEIVNALRNQATLRGLPGFCDHVAVEDLGNHRYLMRARVRSEISFEVVDGKPAFRVLAKDRASGKPRLENHYKIDPRDKIMDIKDQAGKSVLTLTESMGVHEYITQYFATVSETSRETREAGAVALGLTPDERIASLTFATFNTRAGGISFYDGRDLLKCMEKPEYLCEGPHCLSP